MIPLLDVNIGANHLAEGAMHTAQLSLPLPRPLPRTRMCSGLSGQSTRLPQLRQQLR